MSEEGQALVLRDGTDTSAVIDVLSGLTELEVVDPGEINAAQIRRILLAESEDEAFGEIETVNCEAIEGVEILVSDARLLPSRFNNGKGAFVAADVTRTDTGEQLIFCTSAARPAARIAWLAMHGKLPRKVVVTTITEKTSSGFKVYGLEATG